MSDLSFSSRRARREAEKNWASAAPKSFADSEVSQPVSSDSMVEQSPQLASPIEVVGLNTALNEIVQQRDFDAELIAALFEEEQNAGSSDFGVAAISQTVPENVAQTQGSPESFASFDNVLAEAEEPITQQNNLFEISPNLIVEPTTASIVVDRVDDLVNLTIPIGENSEFLKTGSIELPKMSTNTGEIALVRDANLVDEAIAQDAAAGFVSSVAPLRASGVVNSSGKLGILPSKLARGQNQIFAVLTASVLIVAVGSVIIGAYMLGLL